MIGQENGKLVLADICRSGKYGNINHKYQIDHLRKISYQWAPIEQQSIFIGINT